MAEPKRNGNYLEGLWGYSNDGLHTPVEVWVDPTTHALVTSGGSGGGGTQYTEGDTDTTITGNVMMWEDTSDTIRAVSAAKPLPVNMISILAALSSGAENDNVGTVPFRRADAFQATINSADATSATTVKGATTSKSIYVTDIIISTDTIMSVKLQDNAGTPVVLMQSLYIDSYKPFEKHFETPILVANGNALNVIASVAGNISVTALGYVI